MSSVTSEVLHPDHREVLSVVRSCAVELIDAATACEDHATAAQVSAYLARLDLAAWSLDDRGAHSSEVMVGSALDSHLLGAHSPSSQTTSAQVLTGSRSSDITVATLSAFTSGSSSHTTAELGSVTSRGDDDSGPSFPPLPLPLPKADPLLTVPPVPQSTRMPHIHSQPVRLLSSASLIPSSLTGGLSPESLPPYHALGHHHHPQQSHHSTLPAAGSVVGSTSPLSWRSHTPDPETVGWKAWPGGSPPAEIPRPESTSSRRSGTPIMPGQLFSEETLRSLMVTQQALTPAAGTGGPRDRVTSPSSAVPDLLGTVGSPRGAGGMSRVDSFTASDAAQFKTRRVPGGLKLVTQYSTNVV